MGPKKNKGNSKSPASAGAGTSPSPSTAGAETQLDKQLWAALRQEDEEALQALLFDESQDTSTGDVCLVTKSTSKTLVNRANNKKLLPLCYAVESQLPERFIEYLLQAGADVNKKEEAKGANAPIHSAAYAEDEVLLMRLLQCGANPRVQNGSGETALHILAASHNPHLLKLFIHNVTGTREENDDNNEEVEGAQGRVHVAGKRPVRVSLVDLLSAASVIDGSTPLHIALENSLEATEALLSVMEAAQQHEQAGGTAHFAPVVTATTTSTKDSPLHLVGALTQVTANVPAAMCVWARLIHLGADPAMRNAAAQTPLQSLLDRGELAACQEEHLAPLIRITAQACEARAGEGEASAGAGVTSRGCPALDHVMTSVDARGMGVVHSAIVRHQTAALEAIRDYLFSHASTVNVSETVKRWLGFPTNDGVRVVELLASQAAPVEMVTFFEALELIDKTEYDALRAAHQAAVNARLEAAEAAAEAEAETAASPTSSTKTVASSAAHLKTNTGGVSRVQQARKARAAAAAASGGAQHANRKVTNSGDESGNATKWKPSTPMLIVFALIALSVFVIAYTSAVPPTLRGDDL